MRQKKKRQKGRKSLKPPSPDKVPSTVLRISEKISAEPFRTQVINGDNPSRLSRPGISFRNSSRWFKSGDPRVSISVPYISLSGKFSIYTLYKWNTDPARVFASVASTVYLRLLRILQKRFSKKVSNRYRDIAVKVAIYYSITHEDKVINRFLGMARKGTPIKAVRNYAHFLVCRLDENKQFVYGQAYYQANWLKFLAAKPADKSRYERKWAGSHLNNLSEIWSLPHDFYMAEASYSETVKFLWNSPPGEWSDDSQSEVLPKTSDSRPVRSAPRSRMTSRNEEDNYLQWFLSLS